MSAPWWLAVVQSSSLQPPTPLCEQVLQLSALVTDGSCPVALLIAAHIYHHVGFTCSRNGSSSSFLQNQDS